MYIMSNKRCPVARPPCGIVACSNRRWPGRRTSSPTESTHCLNCRRAMTSEFPAITRSSMTTSAAASRGRRIVPEPARTRAHRQCCRVRNHVPRPRRRRLDRRAASRLDHRTLGTVTAGCHQSASLSGASQTPPNDRAAPAPSCQRNACRTDWVMAQKLRKSRIRTTIRKLRSLNYGVTGLQSLTAQCHGYR
jgi:hypothetical protein